jgi:hypothetical protein
MDSTPNDLVKRISQTRLTLDNMRRRRGLDYRSVAAEVALGKDGTRIDTTKIERAKWKFRTRWQIQKVFKENQLLLPVNTPTLKLLYGQ